MLKKKDTITLSAVDVYKLVLEGKHLKVFPRGFWQRPEAEQNAIECVRFLIEDIKEIKEENICDVVNAKFFKQNKLGGMLMIVFKDSPFSVINSVYPNKFKPWNINASHKFWTPETGIEATKWMIEEYLKWNDSDIKTKLSKHTFEEAKLKGMLSGLYNNSPYRAINEAYPDRFMPWEMSMAPIKFWTRENGAKATKWLIEDRLKWDSEKIKDELSLNTFIDNDLGGMMKSIYGSSPFKAINAAYPNRFQNWELSYASESYWNRDNIINAVIWTLNEKEKIEKEKWEKTISYKWILSNQLSGILKHIKTSELKKIIRDLD